MARGHSKSKVESKEGHTAGHCAEGTHSLLGLTVLQRAFQRPPRPRLGKQPNRLRRCPLPCPPREADEKMEFSKYAVSKWFNGSIQSPGSWKKTALPGHPALRGDLFSLCGRSPWASLQKTFQNWGPGTPTNISARAQTSCSGHRDERPVTKCRTRFRRPYLHP